MKKKGKKSKQLPTCWMCGEPVGNITIVDAPSKDMKHMCKKCYWNLQDILN